jgi:hypothetical protein
MPWNGRNARQRAKVGKARQRRSGKSQTPEFQTPNRQESPNAKDPKAKHGKNSKRQIPNSKNLNKTIH